MTDILNIIEKYYDPATDLYKILYNHSRSVADKALEIAQTHPEMEMDLQFIEEASLLHDIGIYKTSAPKIGCNGFFDYICHGYLGCELLKKEGLEKHALVSERHTGSGITKSSIISNNLPLPIRDMLPISMEEKLICLADKFYSKSKPDKVKSVDQIRKSLLKYGEDSVERLNELIKLFLG
ncbi:HDIG domain-containing protein [Bacteroidales bacterium OttesenSCG-928-M11]|nr:HDIG domain-containing protein [Bacteroidales bacterium OttesenSCG-928-M11]